MPRKRRQQDTPSRRRREARRALERAAEKEQAIQRTAGARHEAWAEGGQADVTSRLTGELEAQYESLRGERRKAYAWDESLEGEPYDSHTSKWNKTR